VPRTSRIRRDRAWLDELDLARRGDSRSSSPRELRTRGDTAAKWINREQDEPIP
jgi:hypothetical protein